MRLTPHSFNIRASTTNIEITNMDKVYVAIIGFIGGVLAALISAGILFPPNIWSHELEKSATAKVQVTIPAVSYDREVSLEGYISGVATIDGGWMTPVLNIGGGQCNTENKIYKNPTTNAHLEAKDFCLGIIPADAEVQLSVSSRQQHIDSKLAKMSVKLKQVGRKLF